MKNLTTIIYLTGKPRTGKYTIANPNLFSLNVSNFSSEDAACRSVRHIYKHKVRSYRHYEK